LTTLFDTIRTCEPILNVVEKHQWQSERPKSHNQASETAPQSEKPSSVRSELRPLVFVSHDSRDAELAEAFSNLLTDASGGFLKSYRLGVKRRRRRKNSFGPLIYEAIQDSKY
jgi:hypothetical protein